MYTNIHNKLLESYSEILFLSWSSPIGTVHICMLKTVYSVRNNQLCRILGNAFEHIVLYAFIWTTT